jgi:hypothetical protein
VKAFFDTITDLEDATTAEIEAGHVSDPGALNGIHMQLGDLLRQRNLANISRTRSLPKSVFEEYQKSEAAKDGIKP